MSLKTRCVAWMIGMAALGIAARDAEAGGGFFELAPQSGSSHVSAHRMALSVSPGQTSLWDEITFTGNPSDFVWVLPIKGQVQVAESTDYLFSVLDDMTGVRIGSPPLGCDCGLESSGTGCVPPGTSFSESATVAVVTQSLVGPYETVQLKSSDPLALKTWLTSHGYAIPADIAPVIDAYVSEGFDFLALRLAPGQGVSAMRPVRVTTSGAIPSLPLRMAAAGAGPITPITLWILGDRRYEPTNMPTFVVDRSALVWDWNSKSSNYAALRAAGFSASNGSGWLVESSGKHDSQHLDLISIQSGLYPGTQQDPVVEAKADHDALLAGISPFDLTITRLVAELPPSALTVDVKIGAASDPSDVPGPPYSIQATGTPPLCPPTQTIQGSTGAGQGGSSANTSGGSASGCQITHADSGGGTVGLAGLVAAGLMASRRRRSRAHR